MVSHLHFLCGPSHGERSHEAHARLQVQHTSCTKVPLDRILFQVARRGRVVVDRQPSHLRWPTLRHR